MGAYSEAFLYLLLPLISCPRCTWQRITICMSQTPTLRLEFTSWTFLIKEQSAMAIVTILILWEDPSDFIQSCLFFVSYAKFSCHSRCRFPLLPIITVINTHITICYIHMCQSLALLLRIVSTEIENRDRTCFLTKVFGAIINYFI